MRLLTPHGSKHCQTSQKSEANRRCNQSLAHETNYHTPLRLAARAAGRAWSIPTAPDNHDAHDHAERIRERLPRRLQEFREAAGFTKYGLACESGVSREYIGKIVDETFVIRSAEVAQPVAVRYAWKDWPDYSLANGAGLPASPFRTDDWLVVKK